MTDLPAFTGTCQCGAVEYAVAAGAGTVNVCFCSMCRRATGSPVPSFVSVPKERVTWRGKPAVYASSEEAKRGFCGNCGTPLYYAGNDSQTYGLAAGTVHLAFPPEVVFYYDQHPEWLNTLDELPRESFEVTTRESGHTMD